jgi:8-amino-7-oxononanoate synthase
MIQKEQQCNDMIKSFQDVRQYFSLLTSASLAKTTIGFYVNEDRSSNLVLRKNKHTLEAIDYKEVINFSTSNYLELGQKDKVVQAAINALHKYGTGSNGSPVLSGYYDLHHQLEKELSELHGYEDCILFSSGFMANLSLFTSLFDHQDVVYLEKYTHGSIIMGAKLSGAKIRIFEENSVEYLETLLKKDKEKRHKVIATCGVFSMNGKITNLPELVRLSKKYNATLVVDDAHAFGVIGKDGYGTVNHFQINAEDIHIHVGTLSKSLSGSGGYICAKKEIIDFLRISSLQYMLSASLPPSIVAASLQALNIIKNEGKVLSKRLREKQQLFRTMLSDNNIKSDGESAIVVLPISDLDKTLKISQYLLENNIYANAIIPPGVRRGDERIRFNITLGHSTSDLEFCVSKVIKGFEYANA